MKFKPVFLIIAVVIATCTVQSAYAAYTVYVATDGMDLTQSMDKIHSYDSAGTFQLTFEDPWPESNLRWSGLEIGSDGNVYGCSFNYKSVYRWDPSDGSYIDRFSEAHENPYYLYDVTDMTFGPNGDLYVANERVGYGVVRFDGTTGAYLGQFVDPAGLGYFRALEFGPDGYLYAGRSGQVDRYDPTSGAYVDTYINNADSVTGLEWQNGDLYVACAGTTDTVRRYTDVNTYTDFVTSGLGGLDNPKGMVWTPDGEFLVTSYVGLNGVLRYDATTGAFIDTFCTVSEFEAPKGLEIIVDQVPGDASGDGKVDVTDLGILATNYGVGGGFGWTDGDFTDDGFVDVNDLGILATWYGHGTGSAALTVPEPSSIVLLFGALGVIAIMRCK